MFNSLLWATIYEHRQECSWNLDQKAISSVLQFTVPLARQFGLKFNFRISASWVDISEAKLT